MSAAADAAGIGRATAYRARDKSARFREQWDAAIEKSGDALVGDAFSMAHEGDTRMTIFLLQAHRPEVYGKKQEVEIRTGNVRDSMTPREKAELEAMSLEELEAEINKHL